MRRMSGPGSLCRLASVLILASCLLACDDREASVDAEVARDSSDAALPAPERAGGSITGMPGQPGPGRIGAPEPPPAGLPPDGMVDSEGNPLPPLDGPPVDGAAHGDGPVPPGFPGTGPASATDDGPGPDEAVAVMRAYYEAINAGSYGRAYTLWSDGGNASGQSPQQFADGFDDTAAVSVEFMAPGRIDAAAGSRYIEVPVAISATRDDGSIHHYVGAYTLRRAVVDGASEEQRAWRIASADIREVQP